MPSTFGIRRSIRTTSGSSSAVSDGLLAAVDHLDHREVPLLVERDLQGLAERAVIVGDDHADLSVPFPPVFTDGS